MGRLLGAANIAGLIGLFLLVQMMESGTIGVLLLVALSINVVAIIRLFIEKRDYQNTKFRTSQLVYIISSILSTIIGIIIVIFSLNLETSPALFILLFLSLLITLLVGLSVSFNYLICYLEKRNNTGKGEFFMPTTENRNIMQKIKKNFRILCWTFGPILIVVAILVFVIGWLEATDTGAIESTVCSSCRGSGCSRCDGWGFFAGRGRGENLMSPVALWLGIFGGGLLLTASRLKDDPDLDAQETPEITSNIDQKTEDNISQTTHSTVSDIWICKNCSTNNKSNYNQCKKCGKFRGE